MLRTMSHEGADGGVTDMEILDENLALIRKYTIQVERQREGSGLTSLNKVQELDDGTIIYMRINEGVSHVHVVTPVSTAEFDTGWLPIDRKWPGIGIPDYVSGAVISPVVEVIDKDIFDSEGKLVETISVDSLRNVTLVDERHTEEMAKEKLAIDQDPEFFGLTFNDDTRYSQHKQIRASMYSGYMRPIVQLLLGVGKVFQDTYELRNYGLLEVELKDPFDPDSEPVAKSPFGLYGYEPTLDRIKVLYDYRFAKTHGISWGTDGVAYVVEISTRGVLFMPLELEPISTTPAGFSQYKVVFPELGEPDECTGEPLLDRLGGFPLGSTFPSKNSELQSYIRAGEVLVALSSEGMSPFYSKFFYSTGCGWSFRQDGRRADNTCFAFDYNAPPGEAGVQTGHHYAVRINIGPTKPVEDEDPDMTALILSLLPINVPTYIVRKVARLSKEQKETVLASEDTLLALDNETVVPDFTGTAYLAEIKKGFLYHPSPLVPKKSTTFSAQPQFKISEPILPGNPLLSIDFRKLGWDELPKKLPKCDTPIYVFYKGNALTVINYFWRPGTKYTSEQYSTEAPCQYEGSWTTGTKRTGETVEGNFYSNDFDPRRVIEPHSEKTTHARRLLGETTWMQFCAFFTTCCEIWREVWGESESEGSTLGSHSVNTAVSVPFGSRSVYFVGTFENKTDMTEHSHHSGVQYFGRGSMTRHGYIYDFVMHWHGHCCVKPAWNPAPAREKCVLAEYRDPTFVGSCLPAEDPEIPDYRPCEDNAFKLNGRYGEVPKGKADGYNSPQSNLVKYNVKVFGDTPIHGKTVAEEEMADEPFAGPTGGPPTVNVHNNPWHPYYYPGAIHPLVPWFGSMYASPAIRLDFYSTTMSPWWFLPSPTIDGYMAYHRFNQTEYGNSIVAYEPQFDANTIHQGNPESMHLGTWSTYIGHVAPHAVPEPAV